MKVIEVISENNARPCVKRPMSFCACAKSRDLLTVPKCLIAVVLADVDLPYWTSKVEHIAAFTAIFRNICTAPAQNQLFMNFRYNFWQRRSIRRPRFPVRVQNFGRFGGVFRWFFAFYILNVRHISTSGLFDLLPRKYTTRVDPNVDNSHQVWSRHDHLLPSYSVFVCWYVTWLRDVDLWPFDLAQLSYMAVHVTNRATKFKDPTAIRSWVTSYDGSHWLRLKMCTLPLRMRRITWPVSRG